ncbi:MAG TPA: ABC transporter permease [Vicinamibacterales bacterium]|nr:ABC transporter permease [Vicinamibacterales bacterium]
MREAILQSIENLRVNKLRSLLTMFGIMWGVISIVILSALGEGFQRGNQKVLEELGKNVVIIRNGRTSSQAGGERAGRMIRLTIDDVHALKERSKLIESISPELARGGVSVKSPYNAAVLQMSGIWPVFQSIRTIEVSDGRLINELDNAQARRVVVIGREASKQLFADRNPVGSPLKLNGLTYTIIGRVRQKFQDSNYSGQDDRRLFVPYEAMRRDFPMTGQFDTPDSISVIVAAPYQWVADSLRRQLDSDAFHGVFGLFGQTMVEQEIRHILAPVHGFDEGDREALSLWNTAIESVMFSKMIQAMKNFFLGVSLITLALGGIGVMNIMLVAVRERTREIGLRKALGATPRIIHRQFIVEGVGLTLMSGMFGFVAGIALCKLINMLPMPARFSGMIVTPGTSMIAVVALAAVGILAALYPAARAAALPPVESLRYEA